MYRYLPAFICIFANFCCLNCVIHPTTYIHEILILLLKNINRCSWDWQVLNVSKRDSMFVAAHAMALPWYLCLFFYSSYPIFIYIMYLCLCRWLYRKRIRITMSGKHANDQPVQLLEQQLSSPELRYDIHWTMWWMK